MQKFVEVNPPKWDKDRFEEISEKLDQIKNDRVEPEKTGIAASPIAIAQPAVLPISDHRMAQLPPVTFYDPTSQLAQSHSMALSQMPTLSFIGNGRPRRYRNRRY